MSEPAIAIQHASELDYPAYAAFQREAYRDLLVRTKATTAHMTPEQYRWKYNPPEGPARIARVVQGEETLSSSAIQPLRVTFEGRSVIGWQCMDVATLPQARRKGLLLATLRALMETIPSDDLVFGFPNAGSIAAFLKLEWVENVILTTRINPLVRLVKKRDARVERVEKFDSEHDVFEQRATIESPCVDRRPDYLNWRYTFHPTAKYASFVYRTSRCEGICVVRQARVMDRDLALVMEIFGSTPGVQTALLSHAADWAHSAGLPMMALMSTSLPLSTSVRSLLVPVPHFLLPKRQVLVVHGSGELPASLMKKRWELRTGDWDVF
jgi:hypothetical protein